MSQLLTYLTGSIIKPQKTFEKLLNEPKSTSYALLIGAIMGILYTVSIIGFCVTQKTSYIKPFLIIPAETYYFWEIFFAYPITFLNLILTTGVLYLMGLLFKGQGTYMKTFAVMAFAVCVPIIPMWIVDTALVVLFLTQVMHPSDWDWLITHVPFWKVFNVGYSLLVFIWQYFLMGMAAAVSAKLKFWPSFVSGTVAILVFWVIWGVFVR
jgi:hypothetical protein